MQRQIMISFAKRLSALLAALLLLACGCSSGNDDSPVTPGPDNEEPTPDDTLVDCTYTELQGAFPNPERGFYYPYAYHFEGGEIPSALNANALKVNRSVNRTLVLLEYFLNDYADKPLSQEVLDLVEKNMLALREGGCKCVLRFAYSDSDSETAKPWDASEAVTLQHIAQLKPLFQRYGDVIYVLQAGFIGVWGEWYYTDNYNFGASTAEEYAPRRRVVEALLDAMPKDRQVALRTPYHAMMCFGLTAGDVITPETAHDQSNRSRLAAHNDCFLASGNDVGTFNNKAEREMWMNDTRYVSMGGETCGVSSFCSCSNSLSDMEKYHWSYLNIAYHQSVIKGWRDGDCYDEIERRLGYRFVLTEGRFTKEVKAGEPMKVRFTLRNDGFAAAVNARPAELVLTDAAGTVVSSVTLEADPRFWFGGETHTVEAAFEAPASLRPGKTYTLWLNLPDAAETLRQNPLFSIRMANTDLWDETTGYNRLYTFTAK